MRIHNLSKEEVLKSLLTGDGGLSAEEAIRRTAEYGPNEIKEVRKTSHFLRLLAQFTHFLAVLLWLAAALAFISAYLKPGEGMFSLGIAIVAVIVINAIFTFVQEYRAEKAIQALRKLLPFNVKVIRGGTLQGIPAVQVVPGDLIILNEGDKLPADARLVDANRLMVNNAPLTGESAAQPRNADPFSGDFMESPNIVFAGTHVVSGTGKAIAFATGMSTEFGKIAHLTSTVEPGLSPLQKEIIRVTRIVAAIAAITGLVFFAIGALSGKGFWHNFVFAIGIIIANVPEGLLPTVTLALAMGSQRMAKKKALIKNLNSVETLGSVTIICTDKTGTLTRNVMEVRKIWLPKSGDESGNGISKLANKDTVGMKDMLMKIAYLCNNALFQKDRYHGDPTEVAILRAAREQRGDIKGERLSEIPFNSERKRMTTINAMNGEYLVLTKGALETVLPLCSGILMPHGTHPIDEGTREYLMQGYHTMMDNGLRVIAFAFKDIEHMPEEDEDIESGLKFVGFMGLEDPPRPEVPAAIQKCREAGIRIVMITGDAGRTAAAIARQIALMKDDAIVVETAELDAMNDRELTTTILSGEVIFARMTPRHKMRIVSALKDEGQRVAVTGDGVNDAPALKRADIGIAMGISGTDVAKEAADMVLLDDNFATIVSAVEEGRAIFVNIRKFITYIFAHATPEAVPYIAFSLFNIPLPLTVMQILAIDLGTETLPALALGSEPPEANIAKYNSERGKRRIIDRSLLLRSYVFLGSLSAASVMFIYFTVLFQGGWKWGETLPPGSILARQASTATFLGIVIMQVGTVFACRSERDSIFTLGCFSNKLVIWGIVAEIVLSTFIIYHPLGNRIFGSAPLDLWTWLLLIPCTVGLLIAEEIRKYLVYRRGNK